MVRAKPANNPVRSANRILFQAYTAFTRPSLFHGSLIALDQSVTCWKVVAKAELAIAFIVYAFRYVKMITGAEVCTYSCDNISDSAIK